MILYSTLLMACASGARDSYSFIASQKYLIPGTYFVQINHFLLGRLRIFSRKYQLYNIGATLLFLNTEFQTASKSFA